MEKHQITEQEFAGLKAKLAEIAREKAMSTPPLSRERRNEIRLKCNALLAGRRGGKLGENCNSTDVGGNTEALSGPSLRCADDGSQAAESRGQERNPEIHGKAEQPISDSGAVLDSAVRCEHPGIPSEVQTCGE